MTRTAAVLLLSIGLAAPGLARADDAMSARDAQARFDEGIARAKRRDFEGARIAFTQAYAVLKKFDILFNLALAEDKSGHELDALAHFKQLAKDAQATPQERDASKRHVADLSARTGHIEVAAPAGAGIAIDGLATPAPAPLADPIDVQPGAHKVEAHFNDKSYVIAVNATAGDVVKANFLDPVAGGATLAPPPAPPVAAAPAPTVTPAPPPPDAPSHPATAGFWTPRTITVVVIGGAAIVGIGAGIGFGAKAHSDSNHADDLRATIGPAGCANASTPNCAELASTVSASQSASTTSTVFYVVGGVLAAGAIATWFFWPTVHSSSTSAVVVPSVGPGGGGAALIGSF